jgi:hypothetical protein
MTGIGVAEDTVVPLPSCPELLPPQQYTFPLPSSAHACDAPAATLVTLVRLVTDADGDEEI